MSIADLASKGIRERQTNPTLIADILRNAILTGLLSGGEQLTQDEVAAQFGISRIPVREALRQLQGEGLVTLQPHRGAAVSELSGRELRELIEIRSALESMAIRLAMPHVTEETIQHIGALIDAADHDPDALSNWASHNWALHSTVYSLANRPRLLTMIMSVHNNVIRYLNLQAAMAHKEILQQHHRQFLDAFTQRDTDAAVANLHKQLDSLTELLAPHLEQDKEDRSAKR